MVIKYLLGAAPHEGLLTIYWELKIHGMEIQHPWSFEIPKDEWMQKVHIIIKYFSECMISRLTTLLLCRSTLLTWRLSLKSGQFTNPCRRRNILRRARGESLDTSISIEFNEVEDAVEVEDVLKNVPNFLGGFIMLINDIINPLSC